MRMLSGISLRNVQEVYSGAEGRLWELLMGEQIHVGGMESSLELARSAEIRPGSSGIDLCCASGAGMRFLVRFCGVKSMIGVDATPAMLELARERARSEGLDQLRFIQADVCATGLPDSCADFVWGEDAWCYVEDKPALIREARRIVVSNGVIAFTDWMEGGREMTEVEAERFLRFMKFPSLLKSDEYAALLESNGCRVVARHDTRRFADAVSLYLQMAGNQLKYDALKILGFDTGVAEALMQEMRFVEGLAREGKVLQGLIIAKT